MTYQQLLRKTVPLPLMLTISLFCPKLMLAGGIVGFIAGVIFLGYLIAIYLYTIKLHNQILQILKEVEEQ